MPDRAEVLKFLSTLSEPHRKAMRDHYTIQSDVGRRAELVANDEKYQAWIDHLSALRDTAKTRVEGLVTDVADGPDLGEALAGKKIMLANARGELRGLQIALDLIPGMIDAGQKANAMLVTPQET